MKNEFGYKDIATWGIIVAVLTVVIEHVSTYAAFIFMMFVVLFAPIFMRAQLNGWAYEYLTDNKESNRRVIKSYRLKGVVYLSVGILLGYVYMPIIVPTQTNLWFYFGASVFAWFAEGIIFAALVIMLVQGLILLAKPDMKQTSRRTLETYTPVGLSAIAWMSAIFSGRRK